MMMMTPHPQVNEVARVADNGGVREKNDSINDCNCANTNTYSNNDHDNHGIDTNGNGDDKYYDHSQVSNITVG